MSEPIEQTEFPKKGTSGHGTTIGYTVEARHTARDHVVIAGVVYTDKWKRLNPDRASIGVPAHGMFEPWLAQCGLMNYPAAQAIRWWFHAIAEADFHNLCLETRIVKHQVKYSYEETSVSEHAFIGSDDRSNSMPDYGSNRRTPASEGEQK
ncbi:hypothetical protein QZM42_33525 [Burkholderia vietnamiensis]|uniref:hypothetical protein n=1 Tax=Burkholderia vietnamiensis TaxID=60552 RepID=UPI00264B5920|nr:hypothetical protein [Burkholderia vietnamiensis]MDN7413448.1 hypothetical protein [Burkholderia vietnamiensis]